MNNWVDRFKKKVISSHKRHIIVADYDNLFIYQELKQEFEQEGYTIRTCQTALDVRLIFEMELRDADDRYLLIAPGDYKPLPDIEDKVQFESVGLAGLFPNFDARALKGLSFNALSLLSNIKPYEVLGYEKTLKFLLENLYSVDFETLTNNKAKERVLNALITVFLESDAINEPVTTFLANIARPYFPELVNRGLEKSTIINFIQEQWEAYVSKGDFVLNFEEPLLNRSLGYLFAFELLRPAKVLPQVYDTFPKPLRIGLFVDEAGNNDTELADLIDYLNQQLQIIEDIADQWFKIIQLMSNAKLKFLVSSDEEIKADYQKVENNINIRFQRFIDNTYGSLFSLSGIRRPVVVSRILEHMNSKPAAKKALLVIDGMNYWQWTILNKALSNAGISCSTGASLAFIPTITAWSRQAIFKGDRPHLSTNNAKEEKMFQEFWLKYGVQRYQLMYRKFSVNTPLNLDTIPTDTTTLALVCNDLDEIMHGSILGDNHMKLSTEEWIGKSGIIALIIALRERGFSMYITADHGNVEAAGIKNLTLKDKVGALSRGKRHLHFTNETLLESFVADNPNIEVGKKGLSLYLKKKEAFTTENNCVITHGGSHIWEVIVPFITIND